MSTGSLMQHFRIAIWSIPLTILVIAPSWVDPVNFPKLLILVMSAIPSLALYISLRKHLKKQNVANEKSYFWILYLLLAIAMIFFGSLGSVNVFRNLFGTTGRNNGLIYYLAAISVAIVILLTKISSKELRYVEKVIAFTALVFGTYCALQYLNLDPIEWSNPFNRVIGTLGNPNFSSATLGIFAVFWLGLVSLNESNSRKIKISFSILFGIFSYLAWCTESLQGIIVILVGVFLILYVTVINYFKTAFLVRLIQIGIVLILSVLFLSFLGLGPLGTHLEQYTLRLRANYALFGIKAMINSPLSGVGVDNYNVAFRLYRTPEFIAQYGVDLNSDNAHSTPVQIGASFGLIVFMLYVFLQLVILARAAKTISSKNPETGSLKLISILWILVFIQSLISIEIIGLGVLNWTLGALILSGHNWYETSINMAAKRTSDTAKNLQFPAWAGAATILSSLCTFLLLLPITREDAIFKDILTLQIQNESDRSWLSEQYLRLTSITLADPIKVARMLNNMERAGMDKEIHELIVNNYNVNKTSFYANSMLANYYNKEGAFEEEQNVRLEIRNLDPLNFKLELVLAELYAKQKNFVKLEESVSRIISIAPSSEEARIAKELLKLAAEDS